MTYPVHNPDIVHAPRPEVQCRSEVRAKWGWSSDSKHWAIRPCSCHASLPRCAAGEGDDSGNSMTESCQHLQAYHAEDFSSDIVVTCSHPSNCPSR